ncbi:MAG: rhodanese-like domain-containing protein [Pelagibacteraceae bacterium]
MNNLVTTEWLEKNLSDVRIFDASWHLPNSKRNGFDEFNITHIKNANFFDIDENSNKQSSLPHMLPSQNEWEIKMSNLGIKNSDHIVVYDNSDVISSCRVWYNFLYFNHNPNLISVLDGGLKKWLNEKKETTTTVKKFEKSSYKAKENSSIVVNKEQIISNIKDELFELIDARSKERFLGLQPEPRKELKSGNIKGSKNIPFTLMINEENRTFKKKEELVSIFKESKIDLNKEMVFTCGSGITACILGLANSIISGKKPIIYDGSWAEYGLK